MAMFGRLLGGSGGADRQQKARDLERSGLDSLRDGNLQQAKTDLQKAVGLDPKNATLRGHLGTVLAGLDQLSAADKEFQTAIKLSPLDEWLRYAHGQLLESMLRPEDAAAEYSLASTLDSSSTRSLASLAMLAAKRGEIEPAEGYIRIALERDKDDHQTWSCLAEMHLTGLLAEQGDLDRGVQMLTNAYSGSPDDGSIRAALDKKMLRRNRVSQGIDIYRRLARVSPADQKFYRDSELSRLMAAGSDGSAQPGSDQWLDMMHDWFSGLRTDSSAATAMLQTAVPVPAVAVDAVRRLHAVDAPSGDVPAGLRADVPKTVLREKPKPSTAAGLTSRAGMQRSGAIAQLEFEVARDPQDSKLRRDLSIMYLQAGRLADAKEQARRAEELQRQRHVGGRVAI